MSSPTDLVPFEDGDRQFEITLLDQSDPRSVVNLVPVEMAVAMERVPPEYFQMSEKELKATINYDHKRDIDILDNRIRHNFWREYNIIQALNKKRMRLSHILANCCHRQFFLTRVLADPVRLAWILCPPASYLSSLEESLMYGIEQIRDILEQTHLDDRGKMNPQIASVKVAIVAMLDMRLKGAVIQKTQNVHAHVSLPKPPGQAEQASMEELDKRIKELENESQRISDRAAPNQSPPLASVRSVEVAEVLPKEP